MTPLILHWRPQIPATCCRLLSSCWIPACTTPTSGTSPPWSDLFPWTEASTREEICRRSFSGWGLDCDEGVGDDERVTAAATRRRHFPLCFTFYLCLSSPAEPLWQHQKRAFQNPGGWWQRSDAHLLQSWQRRLAFKAWYVHSGMTFQNLRVTWMSDVWHLKFGIQGI